jgi:hypothetical protein
MKRFLGIITILVLMLGLLTSPSAQAAGKLAIQEEKLIFFQDYEETTYFKYSAIVKNVGNSKVTMLESGFKLVKKDGVVLFETTGFLDMYPQALKPKETGVISIDGSLPEGKTKKDVAAHKLHLAPFEEAYPIIVRFPATAEYVIENEDDADMLLAGITAEVTNNTDSPVFDLRYAAILRDKKGALLTTLYDDVLDVGIPAGGKILLRNYIDHYLEAYMSENSMTPISVEVIAFTQEYGE